ncbi:MAG: PEGA domain-containing protein [Myxococcales bacterium]|nr:PEGA domain-containing protein [Myxococcales bacterium]
MSKLYTIAAVLLLLSAQASRAHAERARARQLFSAGQQAYESGDFKTAIRAFKQSLRERSHPNTLYALAQAQYRDWEKGRSASAARSALELFRRFVKIAPRSPWTNAARARQVELLAVIAQQPKPPPAAPKPKTTQLMVATRTPGARISIDGVPEAGERAPAIRVVGAGQHTVVVWANGYVRKRLQVTAVAERLVVENVTLARAPGALRVTADATGATVFIDGRAAGVTPFERQGLAVGRHAVAVLGRGRKLWRQGVVVEPERTTSLLADLTLSTQRKIAWGTAGVALASAIAGTLTGVLALQSDAQLDGLPLADNAQRQNWSDELARRDRLAISATVLLSVAGAAAITAAFLYWFDKPPGPASSKRKLAARITF